MPLEAWLTLAVMVVAVGALVLEILSPDLVLLTALAILVLAGVLDMETAISGFSDPTLVAVGSLFVVAAGLRETGALRRASEFLFGRLESLRTVLVRLTTATALSSGFLNNTPIVAMGIPTVMGWARRHGKAPSKLLMPLSFASILGGLCTLIGTSTNLVADGLLRDHGYPGLGFFELGMVGFPLAGAGIVYLVTLAPRLLPDREDVKSAPVQDAPEEGGGQVFRVLSESPLVGKRVGELELGEPRIELTRVTRGAGILVPTGEEAQFEEGDRVALRGRAPEVQEATRRLGLEAVAQEERGDASGPLRFRELVISKGSPLVGERISDVHFPERYGAVVTGVLRHGRRRKETPGDVVLRPGDTLLLETGSAFGETFRGSREFYLVGEEDDAPKAEEAPVWKPTRARLGTAILAAVILLAAFGVLHISLAALCAALLIVGGGFITPGQARRSIDWSVLVVIGAALGLAKAMEESGLSEVLGGLVVALGEPLGPGGILAASVALCMLLTLTLTNNAALALVFPVVLSAATAQGLDPRPFAVAITLGASMAFATPLGYQTNLMVYGPGGYRFVDFLRVGLPLQLLLGLLVVLLVPLFWPFYG